MKSLNNSAVRFVVSGVVNTALTYLIYLACLQLSDYRIAYSISYASGIVVSYLFATWFVFRKPMSLKTFLPFPLVYLVQYLLGLLVMWLLVSRLHVAAWLAPFAVVMVTMPVTYLLTRLIVAGKPKPDAPDGPSKGVPHADS